MPEGPSIYIAREELSPFTSKIIKEVGGSAKIDWEKLQGKKIKEIKTWGKHLLLVFPKFTIRLHLLMFGTYYINSSKDKVPKMSLFFADGSFIHFYACAVRMIEEDLDAIYDWEADVLNPKWNAARAKKKLAKHPDMMVADALMNQTIFSGVGNIIKNEVCYRIQVHPASYIEALPKTKLNELVREAVNYSYDFLRWKKEGTLKAHWLAHTKKVCSRDGTTLVKEYLGETARRSFYCPKCQVLYK